MWSVGYFIVCLFFCFMESDSVCGYLQICFVSAVLYKFIGLIDLEYFWVTR